MHSSVKEPVLGLFRLQLQELINCKAPAVASISSDRHTAYKQ
jgi:hypothetical protein